MLPLMYHKVMQNHHITVYLLNQHYSKHLEVHHGNQKNIFTINQIKDAVKILEQSMANFFNSTLERIDKKKSVT